MPILHDTVRVGVMALCASATTLVVGCGSNSAPVADTPGPPTTTFPSTEPGDFVGECGSLTDAEVFDRSGMTDLIPLSRNGIKCRWEADGGQRYVMFTWYRGSPIERERSVAQGIGHEVHDIEITGHHGFSSQSLGFCEVALATGSDFVHWLVRYGPGSTPTDPCAAPRALGELTLEKAR